MNIFIKITQDFVTGVTEITKPLSLSYDDNLYSSSKMEFEIFTRGDELKVIKQFQKVELFYNIDSTEYSLWTGYISDINVKLPRTKITCFNGKSLLSRKISFNDYNFTDKTPTEMIQPLLDEANAREGGIKGNLTLSCNMTSQNTLSVNSGVNFSNILNNIADLFNGQWTVIKNKIIFRDRIGEDRLVSPNFVEIKSSSTNPMYNTLADVDVQFKSNQIVTNAIIKNSSGSKHKTRNIGDFGSIETIKTVEDGNIDDLAENYIAKYSVPQRIYKVEINDRSIGILDAYVGDSVWLRVEQGIELIDTFQPYIITEKKVVFEYGKPQLTFKVSNEKIKELNLPNVLGDMMDRIKGLENVI